MRSVKITWIEKSTEPNTNTAMLGLDETISSDASIEQIREDANVYAAQQGVDLDKYSCVITEDIQPHTCVYCGVALEVNKVYFVPHEWDDQAWNAIAPDHAEDCEWVMTRAHNRIE